MKSGNKNNSNSNHQPVLNVAQIQTELFATYQKQHTHLVKTTEVLNQTSADYRSNLIAINDKIILFAIASASLFITFLGVIFNSDKSIAPIEYKYFVISVAFYLAASIFLLISRWLNSMYIFSTVHKYFLQATKDKASTHIKIIENNPTGIDSETFSLFSEDELDKETKDGHAYLKRIDELIKKDNTTEKVSDKVAMVFMWAGYASITLGYVFALMFFSGVIDIMNRVI